MTDCPCRLLITFGKVLWSRDCLHPLPFWLLLLLPLTSFTTSNHLSSFSLYITPLPHLDDALGCSHKATTMYIPPVESAAHKQKCCDSCRLSTVADTLLETISDAASRAHLLVASTKEVGAWLKAALHGHLLCGLQHG